MDRDRQRQEMQRLRDKFLEIIRHTEVAPIDEDARQRVGEAIGRSTHVDTAGAIGVLVQPPRPATALILSGGGGSAMLPSVIGGAGGCLRWTAMAQNYCLLSGGQPSALSLSAASISQDSAISRRTMRSSLPLTVSASRLHSAA
jgi:hypothetical protein